MLDSQMAYALVKELGSLGVIIYMLRILERLVTNGLTVRVLHPDISQIKKAEKDGD